jgi:DNA polymerase I-like protein with 3'-5' exonuclease and polymerase domains
MEHKMATVCASQVRTKWKFNIKLAESHIKYLTNEMVNIENELNPTLKARKILIDKEPKLAKYAKDGNFTVTTARMLSELLGKEVKVTDIHLWDPKKPFQRFEVIPAELGNMQQVRLMLLEAGWKPTQFTPKGEPKITEDSLLSINSDAGKKVLKYYSLRSRLSVIEGWLELAKNNNGRVYVEAFNLGTPTFRQRHSKVVNVPSVGSFFGKEMRELFMSDDDKVMVGCDSSGNQIRALAHYLNNPQVNDHILNGDIHQHNADVLKVDRGTAKGILYATIFGAGNAKVGRIITGEENLLVGKEAREKLFNALPGLKELLKRLNQFFYSTQHQSGIGYIPALDGRKVFAESNFKLLNYLLQSYEAITVKNAVVNAFNTFEKENLEVDMLGLIHDEVQVQCNPKIADRVSEILKYSFGEFITKHLNLNIKMEGNPKIGRNWYETH